LDVLHQTVARGIQHKGNPRRIDHRRGHHSRHRGHRQSLLVRRPPIFQHQLEPLLQKNLADPPLHHRNRGAQVSLDQPVLQTVLGKPAAQPQMVF
jgi:hypothetical protein